jgi:Lar family restriction alleviation protein
MINQTDLTACRELKPCPFCGGEAKLSYTDQVDAVTFVSHIECDGCDMDFSRQYGAPNAQIAGEETVELWNTRADQGGEDARDAARYRWLRDQGYSVASWFDHGWLPQYIDEAIDAALCAQRGE